MTEIDGLLEVAAVSTALDLLHHLTLKTYEVVI